MFFFFFLYAKASISALFQRARELLTWIQKAISSGQLRDPGEPSVLWFNTFLKKDRFLPETGKPLLPSS